MNSGWSIFNTFLIFLVVLLVGAALAVTALRTYPADVAAAARSYRRMQGVS